MAIGQPIRLANAVYRFLRPLGARTPVTAPVQASNTSFVALFIAEADRRFASAASWTRAAFATEWAPLSHRLMNGFFLSQGLDMGLLCDGRAAASNRLSREDLLAARQSLCSRSHAVPG